MLNYQRVHLNNFKYTNWYESYYLRGLAVWRALHIFKCCYHISTYRLGMISRVCKPIKMVMTWGFFLLFLNLPSIHQKVLRNKKRSFPKKCYKSSKSAHLVVSFCWAPPHVQTAGSPRILATCADTITLCLGSRDLGSPQPTSFAAATSKSSNSLGWAELDT